MSAAREFVAEYRALNARSRLLLVTICLSAVAVLTASTVAVLLGPIEALIGGVLLGSIIWAVSSHPVRFPGSESSVSVSETFVFVAVLLFGVPLAALLAAFDGFLSSRRLTTKRTSVLYSIANLSLSAFASGALFWVVIERLGWPGGPGHLSSDVPLHDVAAGVVVLALAHYAWNVGLLTAMIWAKYGKNPVRVWADQYLWAVTTFLAGGTAAAFAFLAVQRFGYASLLIALALALPVPALIYHTFRTYRDKFEAKTRHVGEITSVYRATVEALAMAVDAKDQRSQSHIRRVQAVSRRLGELVGLDERGHQALDLASLLHDVGKLGVPEYILSKPGKLSDAEFAHIRMHPAIGADILRNVDFPFPVVEMIRTHHERWDGTGYPAGLRGDEIPVGGRILALADFYDALLSPRPYRPAATPIEARDCVLAERGGAFEPRLVDAFVASIDAIEADLAAIESGSGESNRSASYELEGRGGARSGPIPSVFERIAEVNQQVAALCDISRRLGSASSTSSLLEVLTSRLGSLVPFTTLTVHLAQPNDQPSRVIAVAGESAELFAGRGFRPGEGITGWVIANGKAMVNTSPLLDLSTLGSEIADRYRSAMVFPIAGDGGAVGAIALYSTAFDRYTDEHICVVESLLDPVADALRHTLRHEVASDLVSTDASSGLANAAAFDTACAREIARARRHGYPVSLIAVSLDGLDALVEASRGEATDRAVVSAAKILSASLRETDLAARYGETLFAVLLPMTDDVGAAHAARRLGAAFGRPDWFVLPVPGRVRAVIGTSTCPQDGGLVDELLATARKRLAAPSRDTRPANVIAFTERINQIR